MAGRVGVPVTTAPGTAPSRPPRALAVAVRNQGSGQVCADAWYCLASLRHSRWCYPGRSSPCSVKRSIRDGPARNPVVLMRATVSR